MDYGWFSHVLLWVIGAMTLGSIVSVSLALFSRPFDWRDAVVIVRPSTIVRLHRLGWRIF